MSEYYLLYKTAVQQWNRKMVHARFKIMACHKSYSDPLWDMTEESLGHVFSN